MLCAGFFLCRANDRTLAFWRLIADQLKRGVYAGDQDAVNALLRGSRPLWKRIVSQGPSFGVLSDSFFGGGSFTGRLWSPGTNVVLPSSPPRPSRQLDRRARQQNQSARSGERTNENSGSFRCR